MPDETLESGKKTSQGSEMDRQSESETPLTIEMEQGTKEKPIAYARLVVKYSKYAFGKFSCFVHMYSFQILSIWYTLEKLFYFAYFLNMWIKCGK